MITCCLKNLNLIILFLLKNKNKSQTITLPKILFKQYISLKLNKIRHLIYIEQFLKCIISVGIRYYPTIFAGTQTY